MKIVICGSMAFAKEMKKTKVLLEEMDHQVSIPEFTDETIKNPEWHESIHGAGEHHKFKKKYDLIRSHYKKIEKADAILVLNYKKKGVANYIGGNSFLEIGFAYILGKKIFLLNPIPKFDFYYEEILAMDPIVLKGDLKKIK